MTSDDRLEDLERDLSRTKAELVGVRRLIFWVLGGGILVAVLLALLWLFKGGPGRPSQVATTLGATVQEKVRAQNFALVDGRGRDRAELLMTKVGEGPGLILRDEKGNVGAMLDLDKNGRATLALGSENNAQAILTLGEAGPMLTLLDGKGKPGALLVLSKDGPKLELSDDKGIGSAVLHVEKAQPGLVLREEKGNGGAILQVMEHGPALGLSDDKGKIRAWLHVDREGPGLTLFDDQSRSKVLTPYNIP